MNVNDSQPGDCWDRLHQKTLFDGINDRVQDISLKVQLDSVVADVANIKECMSALSSRFDESVTMLSNRLEDILDALPPSRKKQ